MTTKNLVAILALIAMSGFATAQLRCSDCGNGAQAPASYYAMQAYNRQVNMNWTLNKLHYPADYVTGLPVPPAKPALPGTYDYILQHKQTSFLQQKAESEAREQTFHALQQKGVKMTGYNCFVYMDNGKTRPCK